MIFNFIKKLIKKIFFIPLVLFTIPLNSFFLRNEIKLNLFIQNMIFDNLIINDRPYFIGIILKNLIYILFLSYFVYLKFFLKKYNKNSLLYFISFLFLIMLIFYYFMISNLIFYGIYITFLLLFIIFNIIYNLYKLLNEKFFELILFIFSIISIILIVIIAIYMLYIGIPALIKIGPLDFLFGNTWNPTDNYPKFGIFPMILTTIYATTGAILLGAPIGIFTAIFISEMIPKSISIIMKNFIVLLAGIPSVIYGFFGMTIIVPLIKEVFKIPIGDGLLAIIIILMIMILPTIISISETSLKSVPNSIKEASLGLGASRIETIFNVTLPAAYPGIITSIILGIGRAIGETMAVIMVSGNITNIPSLFIPVRTMTAGIVMEMAYSTGIHKQALFAIGFILFIFILVINILFKVILIKIGVKND